MRTVPRRRCGRPWMSTLDESPGRRSLRPLGRHTAAAARPGIVQVTVNKLHTSPARRHGKYFGVEGIQDEAEVTTRYREAPDQSHVLTLKCSHDTQTA